MRFRIWGTPTVTDEDRRRAAEAKQELEHRKLRGEAIETEIAGILRKNHLADKFKQAFTMEEK